MNWVVYLGPAQMRAWTKIIVTKFLSERAPTPFQMYNIIKLVEADLVVTNNL